MFLVANSILLIVFFFPFMSTYTSLVRTRHSATEINNNSNEAIMVFTQSPTY